MGFPWHFIVLWVIFLLIQGISKGNILFKKDVTKQFKTSAYYTPSVKGQLLRPTSSRQEEEEELLLETEFFDFSAPRGPPGWSEDGSPGAPGWRGPPAPMNVDENSKIDFYTPPHVSGRVLCCRVAICMSVCLSGVHTYIHPLFVFI